MNDFLYRHDFCYCDINSERKQIWKCEFGLTSLKYIEYTSRYSNFRCVFKKRNRFFCADFREQMYQQIYKLYPRPVDIVDRIE